MVDVTDGTDVDVRLRTIKLFSVCHNGRGKEKVRKLLLETQISCSEPGQSREYREGSSMGDRLRKGKKRAPGFFRLFTGLRPPAAHGSAIRPFPGKFRISSSMHRAGRS